MQLNPDDDIGKERKELAAWRQMEEHLAKRPSSSWGTLGRKRLHRGGSTHVREMRSEGR